MRFSRPKDTVRSAEAVLHAHAAGINYFDTAPFYCDDLSEGIVGHALSQLPRQSFYVSTKSGHAEGSELRSQLERSLERLRVDCIDFFHIWCLMSLEDWEQRLRRGAVDAALRAKEAGLVRHVACSTHMQGADIERVLEAGVFEGVTLGYSAINFPYRAEAVRAAADRRLGVVAMNPLGGGVIVQNPARFAFLREGGSASVLEGALRFVVGDSRITAALVGFASVDEVGAAVSAIEGFEGYDDDRAALLRRHVEDSFDGLCTGCGYCLPCPEGIPIPEYMDAANHVILSGGDGASAKPRFMWQWGIKEDMASRCSDCGECEARCTQHLPITAWLRELPKPDAE
jgi:predicted aldo/keto reductase-like oxidoreductase